MLRSQRIWAYIQLTERVVMVYLLAGSLVPIIMHVHKPVAFRSYKVKLTFNFIEKKDTSKTDTELSCFGS